MTSHAFHVGALRRPGVGFAAAGAVAAAGALAYLGTHDPHVAGSYPACVLYSATGLYCPACGGTRATYDLMHGDVAEAFARNPAVPLLVVAVVAWVVYRVAHRRRSGTAAPALPAWVPVAIAVSALVFGVLRNVPGWDWLSPA
jgi:hypothetical protein